STRGIDINSGTGNYSFANTITTTATGRSVEVTNHTGGTIAFNGAITDNGIGINLNTNTRSTIHLSGGITANTGSTTALTATGATASGIGVYLNNTRDVVLRRMTNNGTNQNFGIRGTGVTNFTLEYSTVSGINGTNNAGGVEESSISFDGLTGSAAITSSVVSGGATENARVVNTSGTLDRLTMSGNTFGLISTTTGNDNVDVTASVNAVVKTTL